MQITLTRRASTHSTLFHHTRSFRGLFSLSLHHIPSLLHARANTDNVSRSGRALRPPIFSVPQCSAGSTPSRLPVTKQSNSQHTTHTASPVALRSHLMVSSRRGYMPCRVSVDGERCLEGARDLADRVEVEAVKVRVLECVLRGDARVRRVGQHLWLGKGEGGEGRCGEWA